MSKYAEEQTILEYNGKQNEVNIRTLLMERLGILKEVQQDEHLENLDIAYNDLNKRMTDMEQIVYYNIRENNFMVDQVSEERMKNDEQTKLTNDIICDVKKLLEVDELRDQINECASIADKTFKLLKITKKYNDDNYKKNALHLFYQIIKRNYAKKLFNQKQVELLLQILEESKTTFISEDRYYEFDEQAYLNKLDVFPEEE